MNKLKIRLAILSSRVEIFWKDFTLQFYKPAEQDLIRYYSERIIKAKLRNEYSYIKNFSELPSYPYSNTYITDRGSEYLGKVPRYKWSNRLNKLVDLYNDLSRTN